MNSKITVFGAGGFIGSHMATYAEKLGYNVFKPDWRNGVPEQHLGTVIYCNGVGDCQRPIDVMYSHVGLLSEIVKKGNFDRLVYLSSTRVYMNSQATNENSNLTITWQDRRKLFNIAKLAGEDVCRSINKDVIILRPSNVYGLALNSPLFLPSIVRDAILNKEVNFAVDKDYSKDYVSIDDLVSVCFELLALNLSGTYNVASGVNVSANVISELLVERTNCKVNWHENKNQEVFHKIDIGKVSELIDFTPKSLIEQLSLMIEDFRVQLRRISYEQ